MRIKAKASTGSLLARARVEAEEECGKKFDDIFAGEVLRYCIRKLKRIGQTEDYLPLLYRSELLQHQQMMKITGARKPAVQKGA